MKLVYNFDGESIPMWVQLLFWLLYMVVFAYAFKKTILPWYQNRSVKNVSWLFTIYFTLYAIFYCINDDYFQYREWIYGRDLGFWTKENIYIYIILICRSLPFNYPFEVFRLIVWGGGIFLAYQTYRLYRGLSLPGFTLLLLFVFHSGTFCYARASLAMAVYFFGITLYLLHNRIIPKLIGVGIAFSSYYFHHELLIGIAVLPCLFIPLERKRFSFLSIFLLFFAIIAISFVSSNLEFLDAMFDNDDITSKIEEINDKEKRVFRLSTFINYIKFFFPFYLLMKFFWKKKAPRSVIGMYRITYGILMASVAFMAVFGLRSVYVYRIMYISMIPLTLMIGYGYNKGYFTRMQFLIMIILALLNNSTHFINAH